MNHWKKPEFVEIRMDAEINCYSSALADDPRRIIKQPMTRENAEPKTNPKTRCPYGLPCCSASRSGAATAERSLDREPCHLAPKHGLGV
jgi:coenzyme PQQ precursor peptide PqqA